MIAIATLKNRVNSGLSNPEFVEPEYDALYDTAISETEGIVGTKDLADAFVMDIAYYRFLLLVDSATETNENNYKMALGALKTAPTISIDETTGQTSSTPSIRVGQRKSEY